MEILKALVIVNLFVLSLCFLLALTSVLFKQSGKRKLRVNDKEPVEIEYGTTLYDALAENNVFLPAACGGRGTCGKCALKATGGGPVHPLETIFFSKDELEKGLRLSCQLKIREDVCVKVPESLLATRLFKASIEKTEQRSQTIKRITMKCSGEEVDFKPGQYIQIINEQPWEKVIRAYSISSAPGEKLVSIDVQAIPGGVMSNWLHERCAGEQILFTGPYGEMELPDNLPEKLILIAGGVGYAPMRSIIKWFSNVKPDLELQLFWGARNANELYDHNELVQMEQEFAEFNYFPALSQPLIEEGWTGENGFIHELLEKKFPVGNDIMFFVCGPKLMMEAVDRLLQNRGIGSDKIFTDPFDF